MAEIADEIVQALRRPEAYPHPAAGIEFHETHISWVFVVGDCAYKVKRPLSWSFVDYSTLERRKELCEEEVRLNRRTAPETYKCVVPIVRRADGRIGIGGEGEVIEHAVKMKRLPQNGMLDHLLRTGTAEREEVIALGAVLATFHRTAERAPDEAGSPERIADTFHRTLKTAQPGLPEWFGERLDATVTAFLSQHGALLQRRVAEGRIVDGHGDLHAANVCRTDHGFVFYDCIEFEPALRQADVVADLAFLAMDLDAFGYPEWSRALVDRYVAESGDTELPEVLDLYKIRRALVRGSVSRLQAEQKDDTVLHARADAYDRLALGYTLPPCIVATCGLPATGKSSLTVALGLPLRAKVLRTDEIRKCLAGMDPTERWTGAYDDGIYSDEHTARTYEALWEQALKEIGRGRTVILDAMFPRRAMRNSFREWARAAKAPLFFLHVTCPESVIRDRMRERGSDHAEASDADLRVYRRKADEFEPPIPEERVIPVNGTATPQQNATVLLPAIGRC